MKDHSKPIWKLISGSLVTQSLYTVPSYIFWKWIHASAYTGCQVLAHVERSEPRCGNQIYYLSSSVMQILPWPYDGKPDSDVGVMQFSSAACSPQYIQGCIGFMWQSISSRPGGRFCVMTDGVMSEVWLFQIISVPRSVGVIAHILCAETRFHLPV